MKKVIIPLSNGFEEIEVVTPVDILRRGGVEVDLVSLTGSLTLTGRNRIKLVADKLWEKTKTQDYQMILIPGGMDNVLALKAHPQLLKLINQYAAEEKLIGAICAGPLVLQEAGLLSQAEITSHPGVQAELVQSVKAYHESPLIISKNLITSRGAGTAEAFALEILSQLQNKETALKVKHDIVAN